MTDFKHTEFYDLKKTHIPIDNMIIIRLANDYNRPFFIEICFQVGFTLRNDHNRPFLLKYIISHSKVNAFIQLKRPSVIPRQ